jgi:rod shape determining protein RodA
MLTTTPERRLLSNFNFPLLGAVVVVCVLGIWNLASASRTAHADVWVSQAWWLLLGLSVAILLCTFDYRHLLHIAYPAWGMVILLLVAVLVVGEVHKGAQRWLVLGPIRFQPSELAKLAVVLALARFYHEDKEPKDGYTLGRMWRPFLLLAVPVALIMRQPDLGTSLLVLAIGGTLILFARVERRTLLTLAGGAVAMASVAWFFLLRDYQKARVTAFLNPGGDALGSGYHANQSIIAIGSGGLSGKGWGEGTQTQLRFLPEQHTDFVFSVWAEEHGFIGSLLVIGLYAVLLLMCAGVAAQAKERFGVFLSVGVGAILFWHVLVNIGMVTGMLPVVGVTLPFLSYGGSSVVTSLAAVGLLLNVSMRRFLF